MKIRRCTALILALCAALLFSACASTAKSESTAYDSGAYYAAAPEAAPAEMDMGDTYAVSSTQNDAQQLADAGTRKIVYTADMHITADDPAAALDAITQKTLALGGYVSASYTRNDDDGAYRSTATLKVPAAALSELVNTAKAAGKVDSYQLSSDDISLSYYDLQARLASAKAEEAQLLELLTACDTIEDVLAVREQLASVREEIESDQAQINLWDNLVDYATLELAISRTEKTPVEGETTLIEIWKASDVFKKIGRGFINSARFTVNAIGAIGIFIAYAFIPGAILFACIGIPIIVHKRKKKRRLAAIDAQAAGSREQPAASGSDPPQA